METALWDNVQILKKVTLEKTFKEVILPESNADKTKVGWWKNGYPEYFAKVLNAQTGLGLTLKLTEKCWT
jgi:hypothetical protein